MRVFKYTFLAAAGVLAGFLVAGQVILHHINAQTPVDSTVQVVSSTEMQPYGDSQEDEYTATMAVQPADYGHQTTLHASFIQDAHINLQGTSPQLQAESTHSE